MGEVPQWVTWCSLGLNLVLVPMWRRLATLEAKLVHIEAMLAARGEA